MQKLWNPSTLCALAVLGMLSLQGCQKQSSVLHGYVEGDYLRIAPTSSGNLAELNVHKGQTIKAGQTLFSLNLDELNTQVQSAKANVEVAQANLADLQKGQRPEEINVLLKQKAQAQANEKNTQIEFQRQQKLVKGGAVSRSSFDSARTNYLAAKAKLQEVNAQIQVATLGARKERLASAQASLNAATQTLAAANTRLAQAHPTAPADAFVQDTYFLPGEFVNAGQPVVNLLPPDNLKVRFFVPQAALAKLNLNQAVLIDCDGCPAPIQAHVSYISSEAQYTPPVIYSVDSRQKLVFMVEAKPDTVSKELKPGLPVDIQLKSERSK